MNRNFIMNRFYAKNLPLGLSATRKYLAEKTGCKKQPDLSLKCPSAVAPPPPKESLYVCFPEQKTRTLQH
jgi:hypothetical protein